MRWYRGLTSGQRNTLLALALSIVFVVSLLGWNVWTTLQGRHAVSPLPRPETPSESALPVLTPSPSPSPFPSATPSPTSTPAFEVFRAGLIASEVAEARGARTWWAPPLALVDEDRLVDALEEHYASWSPLDQRAQTVLRAFGLVEVLPPLDVAAQASRTAAFYATALEELYLRSDWAGSLDILEVQLAYGYARAFPDQAGNLTGLMRASPTLDRQIALAAVAEGDALLTVWRHQGVAPGSRQALEIQTTISDAICPRRQGTDARLADLGCLSLELGGVFASALHRDGGNAALDDAVLRPPRVSAQILHPMRYVEHVEPAAPTPLNPELTRGWVLTATDTLGAALIDVIVTAWHQEHVDAVGTADWDGDLLQLWQSPEDATLALWQMVWRSSAAAEQVSIMLAELLPGSLLSGGLRSAPVPEGMPRGRWWTGRPGAILLYHSGDRVWLAWGQDPEAVEILGGTILAAVGSDAAFSRPPFVLSCRVVGQGSAACDTSWR